jgi:LEA14-like dessication related protein
VIRHRVLFAALLAAPLAAGCAAMTRAVFKEPVVTYREARVTGLGLSGGSLEVVLDIFNPNGFRLDGSRLTYRVDVDTVPFGTGMHESKFVVERGATSQVTLPLTFTWAGLGEAGRQFLQTGTVEYRVTGDITVATPLGQFTRPYAGKGRLRSIP